MWFCVPGYAAAFPWLRVEDRLSGTSLYSYKNIKTTKMEMKGLTYNNNNNFLQPVEYHWQ